jgi:hypothetical protein
LLFLILLSFSTIENTLKENEMLNNTKIVFIILGFLVVCLIAYRKDTWFILIHQTFYELFSNYFLFVFYLVY